MDILVIERVNGSNIEKGAVEFRRRRHSVSTFLSRTGDEAEKPMDGSNKIISSPSKSNQRSNCDIKIEWHI
jgi:hypothetical protein